MEGTKKLTQAQRVYFTKRIDSITAQKISKVQGRTGMVNTLVNTYLVNTYYPPHKPVVNERSVDRAVISAITSGKIKLLSKKDMMAHMKEQLGKSKDAHYTGVAVVDFINQDGLIAFNKARNAKVMKENAKQKTRISAIQRAASDLKDEVMLKGNLAIGMLDKFEKKEF